MPRKPFRFVGNNSLPINANWNKSLDLQEKTCKRFYVNEKIYIYSII